MIFENRPFAIDPVATPAVPDYQVAGEHVVVAVFGYSGLNGNSGPVGTMADGTSRLLWNLEKHGPAVLARGHARPRDQARALDRRRDVRAATVAGAPALMFGGDLSRRPSPASGATGTR